MKCGSRERLKLITNVFKVQKASKKGFKDKRNAYLLPSWGRTV